MDRICSYRTLIYACNVTVLLVVSVVTDYWQYRSFRVDNINQSIWQHDRTVFRLPRDTKTYIELRFGNQSASDESFYRPPIYLKYKRNTSGNSNSSSQATGRGTVSSIILYTQYGNLLRDCDNLEDKVRRRLGLYSKQKQRCLSFIFTGKVSDNHRMSAIHDLELAGFSFGVLSITCMFVSLLVGIYGTLLKREPALVAASFTSLSSGISLIVAIALFHGKCYLFETMEFLQGLDFPYKKIIAENRQYSYGWSFVLAWICVALLLLGAWLWLNKAEYVNDPEARQRRKQRHKLKQQRYRAFIKGKVEYFNL